MITLLEATIYSLSFASMISASNCIFCAKEKFEYKKNKIQNFKKRLVNIIFHLFSPDSSLR